MAAGLGLGDSFDSWLSTKLKSLSIDEGVFGSYITGILTGDETFEEKTEALEGILSEITDTGISTHCHEILDRWKTSQNAQESEASGNDKPKEAVEERLVRLLESNAKPSTVQREYTEEEKKIREAILVQYSQTSDAGSESDNGSEGGNGGLVKNTNVQSVIQAQKEQREKARLECQKKKEKDKEDRERQKQQQQEKKEKRKTQKGERRR